MKKWVRTCVDFSVEGCGLSKKAPSKKVISTVFLSIDHAARKTSLGTFRATKIATKTLSALMDQRHWKFLAERKGTQFWFRLFFCTLETKESFVTVVEYTQCRQCKAHVWEGHLQSGGKVLCFKYAYIRVVLKCLYIQPKNTPKQTLHFAVVFRKKTCKEPAHFGKTWKTSAN